MADLADMAGPTIDAFAAEAARRARGKSGPESHFGFDGLHCVEPRCGEEIPEARRAMGRVRCVDCQTLKEQGRL